LAAAQREYELVLMLDPRRDAPGRDAMAQEARKQIEAGGSLKHEKVWGLRKMAYEIEQRTEADYPWFRFEAPTDLLDGLNHNLKIADGVLRFRIFQVDPEAPVIAPPPTSAPAPGASRGQQDEDSPGPAPEASGEGPAEETAPEASAAAEASGPTQ
jgi:small subunit ribosomal protein S6